MQKLHKPFLSGVIASSIYTTAVLMVLFLIGQILSGRTPFSELSIASGLIAIIFFFSFLAIYGVLFILTLIPLSIFTKIRERGIFAGAGALVGAILVFSPYSTGTRYDCALSIFFAACGMIGGLRFWFQLIEVEKGQSAS